MSNVKVFNKGQRTIHGACQIGVDANDKPVMKNFSIKPQAGIELPADHANYLRSLYPSELINMEDVIQQFDAATTAEEQPAKPAGKPAAAKKGKQPTEGDILTGKESDEA